MKAMVLYNWVERWGNNLKLEEVPIPQLGPHDILVKVEACGVGLTVSNFMMGGMGKDPKLLPKIPGDEVAGRVAELGSAVKAFNVGDRVLLYLFITCGRCKYCLTGRNNLCVNFGGWIGRHHNGGYAEYIKVPESCLFKLPDEISFIDATTINIAISSAVHVLKSRAQLSAGEDVLIVGAAGGVGVHVVQLAKLLGGNVFAVDIDDEKLERLKAYGADFTINASKVNMVDEVKKLTAGRGVDVAVEFVGTPKTLTDSISSLARGGRLVNLTSHPGVKFEVASAPLVINEWVITGSRYTTKHEFLDAVELVRSGKIKPVVPTKTKLEDVEKVHALLAENKLFGRAVVVF